MKYRVLPTDSPTASNRPSTTRTISLSLRLPSAEAATAGLAISGGPCVLAMPTIRHYTYIRFFKELRATDEPKVSDREDRQQTTGPLKRPDQRGALPPAEKCRAPIVFRSPAFLDSLPVARRRNPPALPP